MSEYYLLLGRALGILEFKPSSPEVTAHTRGAYERYAAKWGEDPGRWDAAPKSLQAFVEAGVRHVALEKLEVTAEKLAAALEGGDIAVVERASQDVEECLKILNRVRPARRGRRKSGQLSELPSPLLTPANHHKRHARIEG